MFIKPDYNLKNIYEINFDELKNQGIKCVMFDLDSTVMMSKTASFLPETISWFNSFIGDFEVVDDRRGGKVVIELLGRINKCGVISPRFDIGVDGYEKAVSNLLPSRQFGYIVLTTNIGIIDQDRARRKHVGGKLLGFFY